MKFRVEAFGWHLLASGIVLTVLLGTLYVGWYQWPGWYSTDVGQVTFVLTGVDLVVGPLLTLIIASPLKPRRVLARDVAVIAIVQLCSLLYGATQLWNGRPLYYAFSEDVLQIVQAYDIGSEQRALARQQKAPLAPHWYSFPRWIWAPLPQNAEDRDKIVAAAISGGDDVTSMPTHYQPWSAGLPTLRTQLKKIDEVKYFSVAEKNSLEQRVTAAGIATDQANSLAFTGRGRPLLAVFDPATLKLRAIFKFN